jgi:copper homeostasis protein (lipoprotein)
MNEEPVYRKEKLHHIKREAMRHKHKLIIFIIIFLGASLLFLINRNSYKNFTDSASASSPITYAGTTPCADCSGIYTALALFSNPEAYVLELVYEGKNTTFKEVGVWEKKSMENSLGQMYVLTPSNPDSKPSMYQILNDGEIKQLDSNGKPFPNILPSILIRQ